MPQPKRKYTDPVEAAVSKWYDENVDNKRLDDGIVGWIPGVGDVASTIQFGDDIRKGNYTEAAAYPLALLLGAGASKAIRKLPAARKVLNRGIEGATERLEKLYMKSPHLSNEEYKLADRLINQHYLTPKERKLYKYENDILHNLNEDLIKVDKKIDWDVPSERAMMLRDPDLSRTSKEEYDEIMKNQDLRHLYDNISDEMLNVQTRINNMKGIKKLDKFFDKKQLKMWDEMGNNELPFSNGGQIDILNLLGLKQYRCGGSKVR